jgi:superfamily II DNA or RNA helicase
VIRVIEGPTKVKLEGDDSEIRAIAAKFRFRPKGFEHAPSYKAYVMTEGQDGWDGFICPITFPEGRPASCLRGHRDTIIDLARKQGFLVDTSECLKSPFEHLVSDDIPVDILAAEFDLDEYQREAVAYWLVHGMGVNKIAVNGGKTAMFATAAAMIQTKFADARILYVTQSERLVRQAYRDIKAFLPGWDITQFGGSKKDNTGKNMVISTVAMLWANRQELIDKRWFASFIAVLADECHHICAPTSSKLMMQLPAYFRLGASDSRRDSDPALANKIQGLLGPIRYTVPVGTYIDMGRSAKPTIYLVDDCRWHNRFQDVPHQADPDTPAWALVGDEWKHGTYVGPVYERDENGEIKMRKVRELKGTKENEVYGAEGQVDTVKAANWIVVEKPVTVDGYHIIQFDGEDKTYNVDSRYCLLERTIDKAIIGFKERNKLIVRWAEYYSQERKFPTLVVCTRTMHVLILETMIGATIGQARVRVLFSDHTPRERDEAFDWFRHTLGGVLISPLVKEGVSIPELKGGIIADHVAGAEPMMQILGRFIRKKKDQNEAFITAFIDVQHPTLRSSGRRVWKKLFDTRGFTFYHPVLGPDSIAVAKVYQKLD